MADVVFNDAYEAGVWQAIRDWEQRGNTSFGTALRVVGKPAEFATNALLKLPLVTRGAERMTEGMQAAVARLGSRVDHAKILASAGTA